MKASAFRLLILLLFPALAMCQTGFDHHVIFDNSLADRSFYNSRGSFVAPSELELVGGKIPVEEKTYFTPPNSLRLKWQSRFGGDWHVTLNFAPRYASSAFLGDSLFVWCYSEEGLSADQSPLIHLGDNEGHGTPSIHLLSSSDRLQKVGSLAPALPVLRRNHGRYRGSTFQPAASGEDNPDTESG